MNKFYKILCLTLFFFAATPLFASKHTDPLPSWNDGPVKQSILDFVGNITDPTNPQFVPPAKRIAMFDNDGTLRAEQPMHTHAPSTLVYRPMLEMMQYLRDHGFHILIVSGDHHEALRHKPIIAFGNSDRDRKMLESAQSTKGQHLMILIHHDDAKREFAYGPESKIGTLSDSLMNEALDNHWGIVSMQKDWKTVFAS